MKIMFADKVEIAEGIFAVEAIIGEGRYFRHEGPKGYEFFTEEQADKLVCAVNATLTINLDHWIDPCKSWDEIEAGWDEFKHQERYAA